MFVLLLPITSSTLVQKSLWFEFGRLWEDFRICHHGIQCKEHEGSLWKEISFKIKVLLWGMGKCKGYDVSLTLNFYNECFNQWQPVLVFHLGFILADFDIIVLSEFFSGTLDNELRTGLPILMLQMWFPFRLQKTPLH